MLKYRLNVHIRSNKLIVNNYISFIEEYYKKHKRTSEIHVDSLILIYNLTKNEKIFNWILKVHRGLLIKITRFTYNKYKTFLYKEDYNEMLSMVMGEFYRRILFYEIPPRAPFSKYVKLYIRRWLNSYTKLIVKKNNRFVLECDKEEMQ